MVPNVALVLPAGSFFGIKLKFPKFIFCPVKNKKKIFIEKYPNLNNDDSCLLLRWAKIIFEGAWIDFPIKLIYIVRIIVTITIHHDYIIKIIDLIINIVNQLQ
jgi:hypothetical protein